MLGISAAMILTLAAPDSDWLTVMSSMAHARAVSDDAFVTVIAMVACGVRVVLAREVGADVAVVVVFCSGKRSCQS
jgi:hypothetical protein